MSRDPTRVTPRILERYGVSQMFPQPCDCHRYNAACPDRKHHTVADWDEKLHHMRRKSAEWYPHTHQIRCYSLLYTKRIVIEKAIWERERKNATVNIREVTTPDEWDLIGTFPGDQSILDKEMIIREQAARVKEAAKRARRKEMLDINIEKHRHRLASNMRFATRLTPGGQRNSGGQTKSDKGTST